MGDESAETGSKVGGRFRSCPPNLVENFTNRGRKSKGRRGHGKKGGKPKPVAEKEGLDDPPPVTVRPDAPKTRMQGAVNVKKERRK